MIRAAIFGLPTAGKSTLSYMVARMLGLRQINMGEILRQRGSARAGHGALECDEEVSLLAAQAIDESGAGFLLDGFPRTQRQLEFLDEYPGAEGCRFLFLDLPPERVRARFLSRANCVHCRRADYGNGTARTCTVCGGPLTYREDATEEALARKLKAFERHERTILATLEAQARLERVAVAGDAQRDAQRLLAVFSENRHAPC